MQKYTTVEGDRVDAIAARELGNSGFAGLIYDANRGLADLGIILPAGIEITLPDPPIFEPRRIIRIYD